MLKKKFKVEKILMRFVLNVFYGIVIVTVVLIILKSNIQMYIIARIKKKV